MTLQILEQDLEKKQHKEYDKKYRQEHKEQHKEYDKKYRQEHKRDCSEYNNRPKVKARHKEQCKKYHQEHKEQIKERHKKHYQEHKEQHKKYRQEHKEQRKEYGARIKLKVFHYYSPLLCCVKCGFSDMRALSIDHINGEGNKHRKTINNRRGSSFYDWLIHNNYPNDYQVLCMNCQFIKRYENHECHKPCKT